jgi:ornithine cyclodeaminase/alanine dehydrogenase-like protein (mu-crystallin family)
MDRPGTHVNAAGSNSLLRREIDEATVLKANPVVVDSRPSAMKEAATCFPRSRKGACTWACSRSWEK